MTRKELVKALEVGWPGDPDAIDATVMFVFDTIIGRVIKDGHANIPGLGSFSIVYSGGKSYGVQFMACKSFNALAKGKPE